MPDNRYLLRQRQGYYAVVEVPPSLRKVLGRRLKKTLQTRDVYVARARRFRAVAALKETIEAARRSPGGPQGDPILAEAMAWRDGLAAAGRGEPDAVYGDTDGDPEGFIKGLIGDRAEALHDNPKTEARWQEFLGIATGSTTPLGMYVEDWLAEGSLSGAPLGAKTLVERRSALKALGSWLVAEGTPATLEAVTRRVAGRYVTALLQGNREPVTVSRLLVAIRGYWSWLQRRGHLSDELRNPWSGQAPRKRARDPGGLDEERAFTDAEVALLLASPPSETMRDFLLVLALTGMRREEVGRLRVADCQGGVFVIRAGKTAAAARRVPVHSGLAAMVARRLAGKGPDAFLFSDLPGGGDGSRTGAIGKTFMRYRRSVGIQDGTARRSLLNMHSFRRWFSTSAVNADQPPHMVSLIVGHAEGRRGMTLGRYWSGAQDDALRAVVESVKLPRCMHCPGE